MFWKIILSYCFLNWMRMKTHFLVLQNSRLRYGVICKILVRYVACEETRRRNKFWNVKHRNRPEYQKCRVVFGLPLLVPTKRRRVFCSEEENRHQKCVERYKMTKCFLNDLYRLWYFCIRKIFFLRNLIYYTSYTIDVSLFLFNKIHVLHKFKELSNHLPEISIIINNSYSLN